MKKNPMREIVGGLLFCLTAILSTLVGAPHGFIWSFAAVGLILIIIGIMEGLS